MRFEAPLIRGTLVRRYKRFLADVVLEDGSKTTVHCPNTGSMLGCRSPGSTVWLLPASNPARKYPLGWELVEVDLAVLKDVNAGRSVDPAVLVGIDTGRSVDSAVLVGINTGRSNALVAEALDRGLIPELAAYGSVRREVKAPGTRSRIDFLLGGHPQDPDCYLEVKNVTAAVSRDNAFFPDAVSTRAARHVDELAALVSGGQRGAMCFCVQRADVSRVRPADGIDPAYGKALRRAVLAGVEVYALRAEITTTSVRLEHRIPVVLDDVI